MIDSKSCVAVLTVQTELRTLSDWMFRSLKLTYGPKLTWCDFIQLLPAPFISKTQLLCKEIILSFTCRKKFLPLSNYRYKQATSNKFYQQAAPYNRDPIYWEKKKFNQTLTPQTRQKKRKISSINKDADSDQSNTFLAVVERARYKIKIELSIAKSSTPYTYAYSLLNIKIFITTVYWTTEMHIAVKLKAIIFAVLFSMTIAWPSTMRYNQFGNG